MFEQGSDIDIRNQTNWLIKKLLNIAGFDNYILMKKNVLRNYQRADGKKGVSIYKGAIIDYARKFYNCPALADVPLQDLSKDPLSHEWDTEIFPTEIMNGIEGQRQVVSEFTILAMEATSFYRRARQSPSELFTFGQNLGCKNIMQYKLDIKDTEYCRSNDEQANDQDHCSVDYISKNKCYNNSTFLSSSTLQYSGSQVAGVCSELIEEEEEKAKKNKEVTYHSFGPGTMCRGNGWHKHKYMGNKNTQQCKDSCTADNKCNALDVQPGHCYLFFHASADDVKPAGANRGTTCYKKVRGGQDGDGKDEGESKQTKYKNPKNFGFESYGAHSRCFMAQDLKENKMKSACLRARCYDNKVYMKFGDEIFTCPNAGIVDVKLKAYTGKVACPDFDKFCKGIMEKRCPFDCSGHGKCLGDGTCQCYTGFSGKDCNTCSTCKKETDPFVTNYERGNSSDSDPTKEKKGDDKKGDDKKGDDKKGDGEETELPENEENLERKKGLEHLV